ncbi:MFS transporter [Streptomyces sp. NA02950]|uniref:MFS transporter n=1 Tax=Streptomyces sp. NA02950 TaxID=2742137 RepID=UPI00158FAE01|nr:MFS transporter [Streptomyces sp. NA02950]QKV96558.1 MFS transporter [Streptomyces sp. NA02950]
MSTVRRRRLTLVSSITGAVIVAMDGTVLTIAQPALGRELDATYAQVQWTSTGYLIAVASLLVFAGRLGDRYGHRRIFASGVLGFAATSAGIGLADGVGWVIGLRVAQGVFGALLQPATLGMLRAAYPRDKLGMPIALRTGAIGVAAAAGPLVGGALVAHLGWRAVFFLNVVPALAVGVLALTDRIPEPRQPREDAADHRLDLPGACLLAVALICLVHTLVAIPETGWTVANALGLVAVAAAGGAFVQHERRMASPLVPPSVLRSVPVTSALGVLVAASAAMSGALFLGTYFLQDVLALDPLDSALRALPGAVMMVLSAPASAMLMRWQGARRTVVAGMALMVLAALLMSGLERSSTPVAIGGCFLLLGAGFGTVMVTATHVIVHQASVDSAGVAGGLQQTAMNIGPVLGIAVTTTLMTLTAPGTAAGGRGAGEGPRLPADAFLTAMRPTFAALAALAAVGAILAARLPGRTPLTRGQTALSEAAASAPDSASRG